VVRTWVLGDRTVDRIGFGAMRLPQTGTAFEADSAPRDRGQAVAVLRAAVELGVNHIDTAAFYFSATRSANELINSALAPYPADLVITTKVGPGRTPDGAWLSATPDQLRGQVEENLRQLGLDHLDVVNYRNTGHDSIVEHVGALADLQRAGLVRHVGLSAVNAAHLTEARTITPIVCVQNAYGLGYRRDQDDLIRTCAEQNIAFVSFFTIAGANREAGAGVENATVAGIAARNGCTTAQVRLAWTLARGPHVLVIPGTGDPRHLADNVAAGRLELSADELALLDSV
jgi:pyridoxine 4-dehydrogenase